MIRAVAWSLALALAWSLCGRSLMICGALLGRSRLLVSWILFGVRGGFALDDLRGLALVLLSMIPGMGFALALAWIPQELCTVAAVVSSQELGTVRRW